MDKEEKIRIAKQNRRRGKASEKIISEMLDAFRVGLLGGEDCANSQFSIECKSRQKFMGQTFMDQCVKNNKRNKIPLVVVHIHGMKHENDLIIIKMIDFKGMIK